MMSHSTCSFSLPAGVDIARIAIRAPRSAGRSVSSFDDRNDHPSRFANVADARWMHPASFMEWASAGSGHSDNPRAPCPCPVDKVRLIALRHYHAEIGLSLLIPTVQKRALISPRDSIARYRPAWALPCAPPPEAAACPIETLQCRRLEFKPSVLLFSETTSSEQ